MADSTTDSNASVVRRPPDPIDPGNPVAHLDEEWVIDEAHGWTKAVISTLATPIGEKLFSTLVKDPIHDRQKRVMNHFFDRLKSLEEAGSITLNDLEGDQSVAAAIRAIADQCLNTVSDEKLKILQNAMVNQVLIPPDKIYLDQTIGALKDLQPIEAKLLRILNNPELSPVTPKITSGGGQTKSGIPTVYSGISLHRLLTESFPEYSDSSIVTSAYNSLVAKQLAVMVELDKGDYFPRGYGPPNSSRRNNYTTKLGKMVMRYCQDPD